MLKYPKSRKVSHGQRRSVTQEAEVAERLGGRVTKASGAKQFEKGDVRVSGLIRIELKTTQAKSFSVTRAMLDKIEYAALSGGEVPAFGVEFLDSKGTPEQTVYVIPQWALELLIEGARNAGGTSKT